jgi:hypothetical protein
MKVFPNTANVCRPGLTPFPLFSISKFSNLTVTNFQKKQNVTVKHEHIPVQLRIFSISFSLNVVVQDSHFIVALNTMALLHRELASAGTCRENCRGQRNGKKMCPVAFSIKAYISSKATTGITIEFAAYQ